VDVNWDFFKNTKQEEVNALDYYISADAEFIRDNTKNLYSVADGIYYTYTEHASKPVVIKNNVQLKIVLATSDTSDWQKVEVRPLKNENIRLTFRRVSSNNNSNNKYELVSATEGAITLGMPTRENDRPLLQIRHISGHNPKSSSSNTISSNTTPTTPKESQNTPRVTSPVVQTSAFPDSRIPISVLGTGYLRGEDIDTIADFICNGRSPRIPQNASGFDRSSVVEIIGFYFIEAERESINPDLAIAQMIWNMQYFSESGRWLNLRKANNYGALNNCGSFINRQIGIRAHIQFLKRLSSGSLNDSQTLLEFPIEIWNSLSGVAGKRKTLDEVSKSWNNNANRVNNVYWKLLNYASVRRR
jgi:hypothetical protein